MDTDHDSLQTDVKWTPMAWLIIVLVLTTAAVTEYLQGRVVWCRAGDVVPWSWDIWSTHNSQHLIDPYSFTHILHGVVEFWVLSLLFRRVPVIWRLVMAIAIEGSWEIIENTS